RVVASKVRARRRRKRRSSRAGTSTTSFVSLAAAAWLLARRAAREVLGEQRVGRAEIALGLALGALEGVVHELVHRLAVGPAAGAHALRERAALGQVGIGIDLQDVGLAGLGVEPHVDARIVAAADGAKRAQRDVLDARNDIGREVVGRALALDRIVIAAVGV